MVNLLLLLSSQQSGMSRRRKKNYFPAAGLKTGIETVQVELCLCCPIS